MYKYLKTQNGLKASYRFYNKKLKIKNKYKKIKKSKQT